MPEISVVMPVYNCEQYVEQAIKSVLDQTYNDYEIIIIDDGSTDKTSDIVDNFQDDRIRHVINSTNKGIISSLNKGLDLAAGKYIARMDGDDMSLPSRFENQINHLLATNADICGCHYYVINNDGKLVTNIDVPLCHSEIVMCMGVVVPFAHPSVMIKKSFLSHNNLRYGNSIYKVAEDLVLWHQMLSNQAKFTNVDKYLFEYREHKKSLTEVKKNTNIRQTKILTKMYISNDYKIDLSTICNCSDRTQEYVVRSLLKALIYNLDFTYFKHITKFRLKPYIVGTIKGLIGKDLLFN